MNPKKSSVFKDYVINLNEVPFQGGLKAQDLKTFLQKTSQLCQKCQFYRKTHYCVEKKCKKNELICWNCDSSEIRSDHFMHQYTYTLPLFCHEINNNFEVVIEHFRRFQSKVQEEVRKIKEYLKNLENIQNLSLNYIQNLEEQFQKSNFPVFKQKVQELAQTYHKDKIFSYQLSDLLKGVKFYSAEECQENFQRIVNEVMKEINSLKWLNDPQRQLKNVLNIKPEQIRNQMFLSSNKTVDFSEIDHCFKLNNQFYTENLKTHRIELKVQPEFLNKNKFYQALIYHLKDSERIKIDNAHINQIRSPLNFHNVKEIQFNCNIESDPSTLRIDHASETLESLTIRKLRQEDIKNLKNIVQHASSKLQQIHIELYNKCDLSNNKDICEFISSCANFTNLRIFFLKIRTESQVKRLYGYLSKFYKETAQISSQQISSSQLIPASNPLVTSLQELFKKSTNLTNVNIEGVKIINPLDIIEELHKIPVLISYQILYDNFDLFGESNVHQHQFIQQKCQKRMKIIYALAKNSKFKLLPKSIITKLALDFLI